MGPDQHSRHKSIATQREIIGTISLDIPEGPHFGRFDGLG